jgi:hypothetical protein
MFMGGDGMMMMAWMGVLSLGLLAAVVALIVWAVRTSSRQAAPSPQQMTRC